MNIIALLSFASIAPSLAMAIQGGDHSGGGGGISNEGRPMTFFSAGIVVEPQSKKSVPGLTELLRLISSFEYLSPTRKSMILGALMPTATRNYFDIKESDFNQDAREKLFQEYSKVTGTKLNELALFAVTEPKTKKTFLLPDFYKLKPTEQMAILFHESLWILHPNAGYQQVIQEEEALQRYLEDPQNEGKALALVETIGTWEDVVTASVRIDQKHGILTSDGHILSKGVSHTLNATLLLGPSFLACAANRDPVWVKGNCSDELKLQAYQLSQSFSDSFLIKFWASKAMDGEVYIWPTLGKTSVDSGKQQFPISSTLYAAPIVFRDQFFDYPHDGFVISAKNSKDDLKITFLWNSHDISNAY
ncbi:MAG: hypothetical protein ACXVCD_12885 [Pseudobdellovibrionaceae bacterium]